MEKSNVDEKREENDDIGNFTGSVLLSNLEWDKQKLKTSLLNDWGIDMSVADEDAEDDKYKDILMVEIGDMRLIICFMPVAVPKDEVEHYATGNYMWPEAVDIVKMQQAHILVAVMGDEANLLERGKLFTKAVSSCLKQENAIAVYTDGAVFQPEFYADFAELIKEDELPILDWVWFGISQNEKQSGVYTYGMKKFGKDEMEVYVDTKTAELSEIRDFLLDMVSYVLEADIILADGETIGFSEEQKLSITRSKGIALEGETIKIGYDG